VKIAPAIPPARTAAGGLAASGPASAGRPRAGAAASTPGAFLEHSDRRLKPDDPAAEGPQRQRPLEIDPEMAAPLGVVDGPRGGETDGEAHGTLTEAARCPAVPLPSAALSMVVSTRVESKWVSAISRAARQWRS